MMKNFKILKKKIVVLLFASLSVGAVLVLTSCAGQSEDALAYYNPTWSSDGRIYAIKETIKSYSAGGFGGSSQDRTSYVVIMNSDGSGEQILFNVGTESYPKMRESPSGNYLALQGGHGLEIRDVHHGYSKVGQIDVPDGSGALMFFDWSPDESQMFIQTEHGHKAIYQRGGTKTQDITKLAIITCWKYGPYIIGYDNDNAKILLSASDEIIVSTINSNVFAAVQYFPDGQSYFGGGGSGGYQKVRVPDFAVLETYSALKTELDKELSVYDIQLNPVNSTELLFDQDPVHTNNISPHEGIFRINLDGTNKRTVKGK